MNVFKNFAGMLVLVMAVSLIACQGDSDDARAKARENISAADANTTPSSTISPSAPGATAEVSAGDPSAQAPVGPTTSISFDETEYNFGTVTEGEKVKHIYKFKNTGKEPLVISSAKGSCGCTVPKWPSDPIPPGGTGEIEVQFDSKGKPGKQTKQVTVTANTLPAQTFLKITGNVEKDPNAPAAAN